MTSQDSIDLERVKEEIRAVARELKQPDEHARPDRFGIAIVLPVRVTDAEFAPTPRGILGEILYKELVQFEDVDFVRKAYGVLLRHGPDPRGERFYTEMLRSGKTKAEVIARLRFSHEGRTQGVRVRGLLLPAMIAGVLYIPLLGRVLRWLYELIILPRRQRTIVRRLEILRENQNQNHRALSDRLNEIGRKVNAIGRRLSE